MSDKKPIKEWDCPPEHVKAFEEIEDLRIVIQKKQDEIKEMAQTCQLKFTASWNETRQKIAELHKKDERAVYGACHLSYDEKRKKILAFKKGDCPVCDQEAQDAISHLNSGQAMGIMISGGKAPPNHGGGVVDPGEQAMREKRRDRGGRGRLFGEDEEPPKPPENSN